MPKDFNSILQEVGALSDYLTGKRHQIYILERGAGSSLEYGQPRWAGTGDRNQKAVAGIEVRDADR